MMAVGHVDFIVEEPSMEAFLRPLLPRLLGSTAFAIYPFQGKDELMQRLPDRLQGYATWLPENYRVVVVVDRDEDDCLELKNRLEQFVIQAVNTQPNRHTLPVINRIAIEELEAWYFGDWNAVLAAYPRAPSGVPRKSGYRDPDAIVGGTWETFERVMKRGGYFKTGLRKIEAAAAIAPHIDPDQNRSRSFQIFCDALGKLADS